VFRGHPNIFSLRSMEENLRQQDKLDPSSSDRAGLPSSHKATKLRRDKIPRHAEDHERD
jgi:hypothetical protein